jgi:hypothetical protein
VTALARSSLSGKLSVELVGASVATGPIRGSRGILLGYGQVAGDSGGGRRNATLPGHGEGLRHARGQGTAKAGVGAGVENPGM